MYVHDGLEAVTLVRANHGLDSSNFSYFSMGEFHPVLGLKPRPWSLHRVMTERTESLCW